MQRAVLQAAESETREALAAGKRKDPEPSEESEPWQAVEGSSAEDAREALRRMQEDLRRQREEKAGKDANWPAAGMSGFSLKERGQGDWVNYQPPSAVLAKVAAAQTFNPATETGEGPSPAASLCFCAALPPSTWSQRAAQSREPFAA